MSWQRKKRNYLSKNNKKDMFFDIIGLVSAEKRLINVVNLEKKGNYFSCLAASRMASVSSASL
ncbi:hypothetical protein GAN75_22045 [Bacteroides thetaiotaomicron]|uniref:Uncharacterized protein n=1 Tax=Bacteroides thetaiotaomicron TaxID=818 RepID=A0A7J5JKE3_BACT4|nr:hypothetical protein GAN75_22045 [Bacteroides thetaiotaomicron]